MKLILNFTLLTQQAKSVLVWSGIKTCQSPELMVMYLNMVHSNLCVLMRSQASTPQLFLIGQNFHKQQT